MQERVRRVAQAVADRSGPADDAQRRERIALLRLAQAKLSVGAAGDRYEREADAVADRVTAVIQRLSSGALAPPVADVDEPPLRTGLPAPPRRPRGHADHDGTPDDRRTAGARSGATPRRPAHARSDRRRRARRCAAPVRRSMEAAFGGTDFAGVRVHTDSDLAPRIGASAFTLGQDIHFAPGQYRPGRPRSGTWLLSHELTHVVQQGGGGGSRRPAGHPPALLQGALHPRRA